MNRRPKSSISLSLSKCIEGFTQFKSAEGLTAEPLTDTNVSWLSGWDTLAT